MTESVMCSVGGGLPWEEWGGVRSSFKLFLYTSSSDIVLCVTEVVATLKRQTHISDSHIFIGHSFQPDGWWRLLSVPAPFTCAIQ